MDIKIFILSFFLFSAGIIVMIRNKLYKRSKDTMLYPVEVKLFSAGLLLSSIGIVGVVNEILKLCK